MPEITFLKCGNDGEIGSGKIGARNLEGFGAEVGAKNPTDSAEARPLDEFESGSTEGVPDDIVAGISREPCEACCQRRV